MTQTAIIAAILGELKSIITATPFSEVRSNGQSDLPQWISAGEDESLVINRKISDLIWDLANALYAAQPTMAKAISRKDWAGLVQRVIGPLLAKSDLDVPYETSADTILIKLRHELATKDWNYKKRIFLFGCSFIEHHDIPPFSIGPVTVWKRDKWLDGALANGRISRISHRRLLARWEGKSMKRRKPSQDSANEHAVADAVGGAPYVCTVETDGIFGEVAKEKAVMAARFAQIGVALMWASPTKAIAELNLVFDGLPYRQTYAFVQDRPEILSGSKWTHSLHGISLFGGLWEPLIQQRSDWWKTLAEAIVFWLSPDGKVPRPKLMNQLVQALTWFHEACREPMPMIATTKFMAALDALTCGGKGRGIKALIASRWGVAENDPIRANGPSFSSVIDELYSQGRSRLIHGNSDRIGHDWQDQRGLAESLARITLILCLHWAADHPNLDDPKLLTKP
ncbi:MAG: hypothetical protein IPN84_00160 [Sphingomonadales bacterium]|nr:hypothetical protein [Sphingomonadales bacterium]